MSIAYHLDDATIVAYAGGSLAGNFMLVAAGHIAMCDHCRQRVRRAEGMGSALLDSIEPEQLSCSALTSVLERIDNSDWVQPATAQTNDIDPSLPTPVARVLGKNLDSVSWKTVSPGVGLHVIERKDDGSSLYMLKFKPGHKLPDHGHAGQEITLILRGAYRDQIGLFAVGDVADIDEGVEHQPIIEPGEDCICLIATQAPARFKGIVPRLLQRIVGI